MQVIRDLVIQSQDRFFTSDNDGQVKHWSIDLESLELTCLGEVSTCSNFIYSMTLLKGEQNEGTATWAVAGENSGIIIYRDMKVTSFSA